MADLTPEALAADFERIAAWMESRPNGVTWTGDGLDGTVAGLRDAAKSIRENLAPAHAALTAERDDLRDQRGQGAERNAALAAELAQARQAHDTWAAQLVAERDKAQATRDTFRQRLADVEAALADAGYGPGPLDAAIRALAAERDHLKLDLDDAGVIAANWPKCPDGCGCRLGTEDADARECACDGPCCMECRENGYPDALSYRDLAVRHVMDDLDEARKLIGALREDNHGIARAARFEAALARALTFLTDPVLSPSGKRHHAETVIREALEPSP